MVVQLVQRELAGQAKGDGGHQARGDQRQTTGEADAHHAHASVGSQLLPRGSPGDGVLQLIRAVGRYVIAGQIGRRDGQHLEAGGGQLPGQPDEPLLPDAIHVQAGHEDRGSSRGLGRAIEAGVHGGVARGQGDDRSLVYLTGEKPRATRQDPFLLGHADDERHRRHPGQRKPHPEHATSNESQGKSDAREGTHRLSFPRPAAGGQRRPRDRQKRRGN